MEIPLLGDILIIFALSVLVLLACAKLRIPAIVAFLLTGILAGPNGLGLVKAVHEVETLAEVGVVLLLFAIGLEFSLKELLEIRKSVLLGGFLQVLFSSAVAFGLAWQAGRSWNQAVFIGFLVSLSSTAIVLKLLQERAESDAPHGRAVLGILIFQDLIVVPMMLVTPLLAGAGGESGTAGLWVLLKGLGVVVLVVVGAKWAVPALLFQVARTRSREVFLLTVIALCFAVAWLTSSIGLSLALGAFLAGLVLSESDYSMQALGNILPFRDVFVSFFFVSIGMLLDLNFLLANPAVVLGVVVVVIVLKIMAGAAAAAVLGFPLRTSVMVGLALAQVGEFSFILAGVGIEHGLMDGRGYQVLLDMAILSMGLTPFLIASARRVADAVSRLPFPERWKSGALESKAIQPAKEKDHLIIVGFGVNGRNLARTARVAGIPHVIIEMNPDTVRLEKAKGTPILFGDAGQEMVLHHAGIETARVLVAAVSDPAATRRIVRMARTLNPRIHLIARTRFVQEVKPLYDLGADEVVPEEFETSVEIFTLVLRKYLVPRQEIEKLVSEVRADGYQMLRSPSWDTVSLSDVRLNLPDVDIGALRVCRGAPADGKTLGQLELRKKHGVSILAIRRGGKMISNPDADARIQAEDVLVALGHPSRMASVVDLFHGAESPPGCTPFSSSATG